MEVTTWFLTVRPATVWQHYALYRAADHALLLRARARWVWVEVKTRRPIRIPSGIRAALGANLHME